MSDPDESAAVADTDGEAKQASNLVNDLQDLLADLLQQADTADSELKNSRGRQEEVRSGIDEATDRVDRLESEAHDLRQMLNRKQDNLNGAITEDDDAHKGVEGVQGLASTADDLLADLDALLNQPEPVTVTIHTADSSAFRFEFVHDDLDGFDALEQFTAELAAFPREGKWSVTHGEGALADAQDRYVVEDADGGRDLFDAEDISELDWLTDAMLTALRKEDYETIGNLRHATLGELQEAVARQHAARIKAQVGGPQ